MPRRRSQQKETITDSLHVTFDQKLSRYSQLQSPSLLLTLEQLARLALLERKRLIVILIRKLQRQRHPVAFDRAAVRRRFWLRYVIRSDGTASFARKSSGQSKLPFTINDERTFNLAMRAVELNLGRARPNIDSDVLPAPHAHRDSLCLLRVCHRRNQQKPNSQQNTDASRRIHSVTSRRIVTKPRADAQQLNTAKLFAGPSRI